MGSTVTDRIAGVSTSVAIKAPVKAITQGNITLSGLGVQGGGSWTESLTAGDRVLVKDQTDATENGVYTAFTSEWRRATDFNGYRDVVKGTSVPIESTGDRYRVITENPILLGTSEINFQLHPQDARVIPVSSRTAMKAYNVPPGTQFSLEEGGRSGKFVFRSGDQSVNVSADSQEGIWVAPDSDATGSSGAFMRLYDGITSDGGLRGEWFGAAGSGNVDDAGAIQAAMDYAGSSTSLYESGGCVYLGKGMFRLDSGLIFKSSWVSLRGAGEAVTVLNFTGNGDAIGCGPDNVYSYNNISDIAIRLTQAGTLGNENAAIRIDKMQAAKIERFLLVLEESHQIGILGVGNGAGSAPYYNHIDSFFISGKNQKDTALNQRAFVFKGGPLAETTQDSPNANIITNCKRISGLHVAFDVEEGNANMWSNINMEAVFDYGFRWNYRTPDASGTATSGSATGITDTGAAFPGGLGNGTLKITAGTGAGYAGQIKSATSTSITLEQPAPFVFDATSEYEIYRPKANNNKVENVRHEGTSTAAFFQNYYGGFNNTLTGLFTTGTVEPWQNLARCSDSFCAVNRGQLIPLQFHVENLAADSSVSAFPAFSSFTGGSRIPRSAHIIAVSAACKEISGSEPGTATIKIYRAGSYRSVYDTVITGANNNGFSNYIAQTDSAASRNMRNANLGVQVETSADWGSANGDIYITVWLIA